MVQSGQIYPVHYSKRTSKSLNMFWAGVILYTTSYMLDVSGVVPHSIYYLEFLGVFLILIPSFQLIKFRIEDPYLRTVYLLYLLWLATVVARGFTFNYDYIRTSLTDAYFGIFLYLAPLILLFPNDLIYLKKVIAVIMIISAIYIVCDALFLKALLATDSDSGEGKTIIEYFAKILAIPSGFLLLTMYYHRDKRRYWALAGKLWFFFVILLTMMLAIIRARRGLIFMSFNILVILYFLYNYIFKKNLFFKVFPIFLLFFAGIYAFRQYSSKASGMFSLLSQRLEDDSRAPVEDYFFQDMSQKDWLIGRGMDGTYYCPTSGDTETGYRQVIETDYLQIILKGGLISFGLLMLIMIPAIFKGLFYSRNVLSKAAALWIVIWLIDSYPATVSVFTVNYLLVWICAGICYSKKIRKMPEQEVLEQFHYMLF